MLTVAQFYAASHRGNAFGVKGPLYGSSGHRGDDTNGWAVGTGIPSFVSGAVVFSGHYVSLGWVTTVQTVLQGRTAWASFCHEYSRGPSVGTPIYIGSWVGPLGNSGTLTLGKHVHVVVSFTSSDPRFGAVVDPRPFINAAKLTSAGSGGSPIADDAQIFIAPSQKGTTMTQALHCVIPAGIPADMLARLRSFPGGSTVDPGEAVYALVGDSPGTRANVLLSQLDSDGNAWAADHTGSLDETRDGVALKKGVRTLLLDSFMATLDAYATPVAVAGGTGGGSSSTGPYDLSQATIDALAHASAAAFFAEQKKPGN